MHMYHSWGSQNAWLRQITSQNRLFVHRETGARASASPTTTGSGSRATTARVSGQVRLVDGVNPDTVWTWNAIGKRRGALEAADDAPEAGEAFLLNHVISELAARASGRRRSNADPVTGQAAWFDLRVQRAPMRRCGDGGRAAAIRGAKTPTGLAAAPSRRSLRRAVPPPARGDAMTSLPPPTEKKLGLVIDLDTCVGCHACATSCKEWNTGGQWRR